MGLFGFGDKKKKAAKLFMDALQEASKEANRTGPLVLRNQKPAAADYGMSTSNPICTNSLTGTEMYLSRICTKDKKRFTWSSYKSIRAHIDGIGEIGEDKYTIFLDGKPYADLYFVLYIGESEFPPAGLYFCDDNRDWDLEREALSMGISVNTLLLLRKQEEEQRKIKEKKEFERQAQLQQLSSKYPKFNLQAEIKNDLFLSLVKLGFDYTTVYEYIHKDELFTPIPMVQNNENSTMYTEEYFYNLLYQIEDAKRSKLEDPRKMPKHILESKALEEMGVSVETYIRLRLQEINLETNKWERRKKVMPMLASQAANVKKQFPTFDLATEWGNDIFRKVSEAVGVMVAYEIMHFTEYYIPKANSFPPASKTTDMTPTEAITIHCRKCGAKLPSDSKFCYKCGAEVINV